MDLAAIRAGIKTRLQTITGLRVAEFVADTGSVPLAVVWGPDPIAYDEYLGTGGHRLTFTIRVLAGRTSDRGGQTQLDGYVKDSGAKSVPAAIEGDVTLSGTVASSRVVSSQNRGSITLNTVDYYAVDFTVDVMT